MMTIDNADQISTMAMMIVVHLDCGDTSSPLYSCELCAVSCVLCFVFYGVCFVLCSVCFVMCVVFRILCCVSVTLPCELCASDSLCVAIPLQDRLPAPTIVPLLSKIAPPV